MTMTIKKLINELEKIDNKFLEVMVHSMSRSGALHDIDYVKVINKKVWIVSKKEND